MSECTFDRLDALISLGARSLVDKEAEKFMQITEDAEISSRAYRRVERMLRSHRNKDKMQKIIRPAKVACVACLICISVTFTACVSIPSVRKAMWTAVVEWYDEYISITFKPEDTETPLPEFPKTIEEINLPGYMPDGYSSMMTKTKNSVFVEYYDLNDEYAYTFVQELHHDKYFDIDETEQDLHKIDIGGVEGVLVIDEDMMSITWKDGKYSYVIQGVFESREDLLRVCNSVKILDN